MESRRVLKWSDRRVKESCFRAWMLLLIRTALKDRRNLRAELGNKKGASIWQMSKAQLVEQAVQKLGWERAKAEQETKTQLQLYLKELATMTARGPLLPAGWKRYKTVELQRLMRERSLEAEGKTNQEMVRELLLWEETASALGPDQTNYDTVVKTQMDISDASSHVASGSWQVLSTGSVPSVPNNPPPSPDLTEVVNLKEQIKEAHKAGWTKEQMMEWFQHNGTVHRFGQETMVRLPVATLD